jgi:hypothetical protein
MTEQVIEEAGGWWQRRFGLARSETPEANTAVINYLAKNAGDQDAVDIEISFNFLKSA